MVPDKAVLVSACPTVSPLAPTPAARTGTVLRVATVAELPGTRTLRRHCTNVKALALVAQAANGAAAVNAAGQAAASVRAVWISCRA